MRAVTLVSFFFLAMMAASGVSGAAAHPLGQSTLPFKAVPTQVCACGSLQNGAAGAGVVPSFHTFAPMATYDEQLGITFTQSFTSLAFNVTATEQTDTVAETGPAYLINGLGNSGYWFQVGLSWNWNPGTVPGTGFDMNYEVFSDRGQSIYPSDGSGGLQAFNGPVHQGDLVLLNLYIQTGEVVMIAHDYDTNATSEQSFNAEGSTSFVGDSSAVANANGFFTGLMTEWYHTQEYLSNEKQVIFSESTLPLTSAWMWMDEYDPNNQQSVFSNTTQSPTSFTGSPSKLQEFSSNGATEYMDAYEFVTGALAGGNGTVPVVLSYRVVGGGSGYTAPVVFYTSGGTAGNATLSTTPATFNIDQGSTWTVGSALPGSSSTERWQTSAPQNSTATSAGTADLTYYHQYSASVSYSLQGAGGSPPDLTYTSFGKANSSPVTTSAQTYWLDSGSTYSMANPLRGSTGQERWAAAGSLSGTATTNLSLQPTYYQQFLTTLRYSVIGGGNLSSSAPTLKGASFGKGVTETLSETPTAVWLDEGSTYNATSTFGDSNERWGANDTSGQVTNSSTLDFAFQNQYFVQLRVSPSAAGLLSTTGGWYDAGSQLQVGVTPSPGWKLQYWVPSGSAQLPTASTGNTLSMQVNAPVNDTALFYPGLTITATPGVSVSYSYASAITSSVTVKGTIPPGQTATIYVPPSQVQLSASGASFLSAFTGWSGVSSSTAPSVSLSVNAPESISAQSSYNYLDIAAIAGIVLLVIVAIVVAVTRARKKQLASPAA